ncbi:MAG: hypothetical protein AAF657_25590 [Acidobacteriota bacterium]
MKTLVKQSFLNLATLAVSGAMLIYGGSIFFGDEASAQMHQATLPMECADDPSLAWRCIVIGRDEPGIASESLEDNCIDPKMLAPFDIDGKGRVLSYVIVGRVIEGCTIAE